MFRTWFALHRRCPACGLSFERDEREDYWLGAFLLNFIVTETLYNGALLGPDAYDEFCITVPNDPRIPNGGQKQCGYYDVKPQFFGQGTLRVTNANEFGKEKRYWDGLTFAANGRLPHGIQLGGGVDFGRQVDDHCFTVNVPNQPNDINNSPLNGGASVTAIITKSAIAPPAMNIKMTATISTA